MDVSIVRDFVGVIAVVASELGLLIAVGVASYVLATWAIRRLATFRQGWSPDSIGALRSRVRRVFIALISFLAVAILGYNIWLAWRRVDVPTHTMALVGSISVDVWRALAMALVKLAAAALGVVLATRALGHGLRRAEAAFNRWDRIRDNDRSLAALFAGLYRAIAGTGWMLLAVYGLQLFAAPPYFRASLSMLIRAYLVIAVGLLIIRSSIVIVDTLDGLAHGYAERRGWLRHYDHLRPLVPTFRACLEYALWVALASMAILQFGPMGNLAVWGPKLIQAIAIFFLSRVVIELGRLEIGRRVLPQEGLDDMTRRRRETIAPLVRSAFTYGVYFGAAVLILASLGFNPIPFLAGAGILGLVVGFGAQSLINDVVSGFFILFENTFLVGDVVEAGGARGVVEAIEFRTTKIRDGEGRVHIIRNGDVKEVVNYSKDYTLAVVPVDVVYYADLRLVFTVLREAGKSLREENADVIGDTEIDGITAFGVSTMTIRTSTPVKPGRHEAIAAALRLSIKEGFDRRAASAARRGLVPVDVVGATAPDPRDRREHAGDAVDRGRLVRPHPEAGV